MNSELFSLKNRKALVTGSSRGIGAAIALCLAEAGADVAIHYTGKAEQAHDVAKKAATFGVKTTVVHKDLYEADAAAYLYNETVAALGQLDILVLNASVQIPINWREITPEAFDKQMVINYRRTLDLLHQAVPAMQERRWGRVISIGSVQETVPHPDMLVYSSLKCAQTAMIVSLAKQLAPFGITANNIAPGVIQTDRNVDRLADTAYAKKVLNAIPVGFLGEPPDCVGAALLLASEAGRYITGQNLFVDGGMSL